MSKQWTIALLALAYFVAAFAQNENASEVLQPTTCPEVVDGEEYTWSSDGLYQNMQCLIKLDKGYKLEVTVEEVDTDPKGKDFLVITSDSDVLREGTGIVFAHKLDNPKTFLVNSNRVLIKFEVNGNMEDEVKHEGFSLKYKRIGEMISTTTEIPIPGSTWPTPPPGVGVYLKVFVGGFAAEDYLREDVSEKFKSAVVEMAEEYCKVNDIPVAEDISTSNVLVSKVSKCKYDWPETETCAEIIFAVPVILEPGSKDKYQLTKQDLEVLWLRYSAKYLNGDFWNYKVPDIEEAVTSWGLAVGLVLFCLVLSVGIVVVFRDCGFFRKNDDEDDINYIMQDDKRISGDSLSPYPVQSFPSIFEQEDKSFASHFNSQYGAASRVDVSDDDSEIDLHTSPNFTNAAFVSDL